MPSREVSPGVSGHVTQVAHNRRLCEVCTFWELLFLRAVTTFSVQPFPPQEPGGWSGVVSGIQLTCSGCSINTGGQTLSPFLLLDSLFGCVLWFLFMLVCLISYVKQHILVRAHVVSPLLSSFELDRDRRSVCRRCRKDNVTQKPHCRSHSVLFTEPD